MDVTCRKDRELGEELCHFLRGSDGHGQVATADRLKLGALCEQSAVVARLVVCEFGNHRREDIRQGNGTLVCFRTGSRHGESHFVRRQSGTKGPCKHRCGKCCAKRGTTCQFEVHFILPGRFKSSCGEHVCLVIAALQDIFKNIRYFCQTFEFSESTLVDPDSFAGLRRALNGLYDQ